MSWKWFSSIVSENWDIFLIGAGVTLLISIIGTIIGSIIGLLIGTVRTIPIPDKGAKRVILKVGKLTLTTHKKGTKRALLKAANALLTAYVEFFRGTPMIVQAMVIYYGSAMAFGISMDAIPAGIFIVSINTGAYTAEIVRGGIISIDKGQFEAAHAIGMNHIKTMLHVILPQVLRNILPAIGNEFVINIKDTSVLNVISVSELYFTTKSIAGNNFRYFEAFAVASILYLIMTLTVTRILRLIERKMEGPENFIVIPGNQMQVERPEDALIRNNQNGTKF